ncbi:MAG: hypothetical protein E3K37_16480 [Candidatus Kuenenia sp.]|nr:hypothetical protein [Candidatus Kuenenia hertensis]
MEFLLHIIKYMFYIHDNVFWLKELSTTVQSIVIFLLAWRYLSRGRTDQLIFLMTCVCFVGIFALFFGYWSDNDIFKFFLPSCLLLHLYQKRDNKFALFAVLIIYIYSSYEYYRGFNAILTSIASHFFIVVCIIVAKEEIFATIFVSAIIGILINYVGCYGPSGTNDFYINSGIIGLSIKGIALYTKNNKYDTFLTLFWVTLLWFAYFGSWIFYLTEPICPLFSA